MANQLCISMKQKGIKPSTHHMYIIRIYNISLIYVKSYWENTHAIAKVWNISIYTMKIYSSQVFVFWKKHAIVKFWWTIRIYWESYQYSGRSVVTSLTFPNISIWKFQILLSNKTQTTNGYCYEASFLWGKNMRYFSAYIDISVAKKFSNACLDPYNGMLFVCKMLWGPFGGN